MCIRDRYITRQLINMVNRQVAAAQLAAALVTGETIVQTTARAAVTTTGHAALTVVDKINVTMVNKATMVVVSLTTTRRTMDVKGQMAVTTTTIAAAIRIVLLINVVNDLEAMAARVDSRQVLIAHRHQLVIVRSTDDVNTGLNQKSSTDTDCSKALW